ncbi:MAG: hypothetical protein JNK53_00985 [Phycisphaerae bacterium]|nr:hypothetical protein [Phycisphaerae bacterium]
MTLLLVGGCSATGRVAEAASRIAGHAQADKDAWTSVADRAPAESAEGVKRADAILAEVAEVHSAVTQTRDNSVWDRLGGLVETVMWAAIAVAGCVLVLYVGGKTGIFAVVGSWLQFVTPAKRGEAALMLDTLDSAKPESARELVANLRGRDPALNRAIESEKRRRRGRPAGAAETPPSREIRT